jgi:CheY-like chemotaxis protein
LIDDLLDTSRIISGNMRLELRPVDLSRVIDSALESARPALELKRIELRRVVPEPGPVVSGDPNRLQQIIWNLLSNAIKFTPPEGRVDITVAEDDRVVSVSVADTGDGIPAAFLGSVFDRFKQADGASTRKHGGLGLGLAITRHLVELHGGTISAESEGAGRGALFTLELPLANKRSAATSDLPAAPTMKGNRELDGLAVLVVDDDDDAREVLMATLEQFGVAVSGAASAAEALTFLAARRPDVLLSDIGMPGEDGYALIRRLRALPVEQGGSIPAGAITAYARDEDRTLALQAGYQLHMAKPVDPTDLIEAVTALRRLVRH